MHISGCSVSLVSSKSSPWTCMMYHAVALSGQKFRNMLFKWRTKSSDVDAVSMTSKYCCRDIASGVWKLFGDVLPSSGRGDIFFGLGTVGPSKFRLWAAAVMFYKILEILLHNDTLSSLSMSTICLAFFMCNWLFCAALTVSMLEKYFSISLNHKKVLYFCRYKSRQLALPPASPYGVNVADVRTCCRKCIVSYPVAGISVLLVVCFVALLLPS